MNQAFQRLRPFWTAAGVPAFQARDLRAKYGTDHPDGQEALDHASPSTFKKHYQRQGKKVTPLR